MPRPAIEIPSEVTKNPKFLARFQASQKPTGECVEWSGSRNQYGYGQIETLVSGRRKAFLAHRVAWVMENGPIPQGMVVMHSCDNPSCCNIKHLSLGTSAQNTADALAKGRIRSGFVGHWRGKKGAKHPQYIATDPRVIELRFGEGHSFRDISRITGHPYGRVMRFCRRHVRERWIEGRRALRKSDGSP